MEDFEPLAIGADASDGPFAYIRGWAGCGWTGGRTSGLAPLDVPAARPDRLSAAWTSRPPSSGRRSASRSCSPRPPSTRSRIRTASWPRLGPRRQIDTLQVLSTGSSTTLEDVAAIGHEALVPALLVRRSRDHAVAGRAGAGGRLRGDRADASMRRYRVLARERAARSRSSSRTGVSQPNLPEGPSVSPRTRPDLGVARVAALHLAAADRAEGDPARATMRAAPWSTARTASSSRTTAAAERDDLDAATVEALRRRVVEAVEAGSRSTSTAAFAAARTCSRHRPGGAGRARRTADPMGAGHGWRRGDRPAVRADDRRIHVGDGALRRAQRRRDHALVVRRNLDRTVWGD